MCAALIECFRNFNSMKIEERFDSVLIPGQILYQVARVRTRPLSSSVVDEGTCIGFKSPLRKDLAILLLSRGSAFCTFSFPVVGISAGLTTMESIPKSMSLL